LIGQGKDNSKSSDASHIHGGDGLGNASNYLPKVKVPKKILSSADLIEKILGKYPETQILIFGPMTNIAQHIEKNNTTPINRVIAMGGALQVP
jgi:inosine-uridine nucleoside N-ribohydrolase